MKHIRQLLDQIIPEQSNVKKIEIFSEFLRTNPACVDSVKFLNNEITGTSDAYGVGPTMISVVIKSISGIDIRGGLMTPSVSIGVEKALSSKRQKSIFSAFGLKEELPNKSISYYVGLLEKLAAEDDNSSKQATLKTIYSSLTPAEAKYMTAHILRNDMALGYGYPTMVAAISMVTGIPRPLVEGYNVMNNELSSIFGKTIEDVEIFDIKMHVPTTLQGVEDGTLKRLQEHKSSIIQGKADGIRASFHITKDQISIFSRKKENLTKAFPDIVMGLEQLVRDNPTMTPMIIEGEIIVGQTFSDCQLRTRRKHDIETYAKKYPAKAMIFDAIKTGENPQNFKLPLRDRLAHLMLSLKFNSTIFLVKSDTFSPELHDEQSIKDLVDIYIDNGFEGFVVKDTTAHYEFKKTKALLKFKKAYTVDLQVTNAIRGNNSNSELYSSFELSTSEGLTIGNVGSGIKDDVMKELTEMYDKGITIILEIAFEGIQETDKTTSSYVLRFPKVICIRLDKVEVTSLVEIVANAKKV